MSNVFNAVRISDHVHWVGAVDWEIRDFHGYETGRGTTYNAYLVTGDETVLIDTVKKPFFGEMMSRIASVMGPGRIDYLISNHSEMDHTGALPETVSALKPKKVFASAGGKKALFDHFGEAFDVTTVKDGESLKLGGLDFTFLETRMLHWPDSMVTFLANDRILFSQDGFGMHLASSERFADELPDPILEHEGARYFANILLPYSSLVLKLLERVTALNLPLQILAPDHGPVWRRDILRMPGLWGGWARQKPTAKAIIVYDTMWQSTGRLARALSEGLIEGGISTKVMPLEACHRSDVATELLGAAALFAGSPTLNNHLLPRMADLLTYLKGLKPKNLVGGAFGSYGWSGEGAKQVKEILSAMGVEMLFDEINVRYVPKPEDLLKCRSLGLEAAERIQRSVKDQEG